LEEVGLAVGAWCVVAGCGEKERVSGVGGSGK